MTGITDITGTKPAHCKRTISKYTGALTYTLLIGVRTRFSAFEAKITHCHYKQGSLFGYLVLHHSASNQLRR